MDFESGKIEEGKKLEGDQTEKKEIEMSKTGEQLKEQMYNGGAIDISKLISAEDIQFEVDPGTKFMVQTKNGTVNIDSNYILASKISDNKYINLLDGKLTVCDLDFTKEIIDREIKTKPDTLVDFKKAIESQKISGNPLSELFDYIDNKYFKQEINEKVNPENITETTTDSINPESQEADKLKEAQDKAKKDFLEYFESIKIDHGKDIKKDSEEIRQRTIKLIEEAKDSDFVDIELAKGIKTIREMAQKAVKEKDNKKIDELMNKINKL